MTITEKDIFDYVYFKDTLERERLEYIEKNIELFSVLIDFYKGLDYSLNEALSPEIEKRLDTILTPGTRIELFPVDLHKNPDQIVRLAAASISEKKTLKALSFADKESKYIVRALFFEDKTELFVLSAENQPLENFKVITKPSLKEYPFKDNKHSILTDEKEIDQIEIIYG